MLQEIRDLISSVQSKASGEGQLQTSVGELMNAVREQMKNGAEQRTTLGTVCDAFSIVCTDSELRLGDAVTDSVLEIINRQRYEQEQMLRALSTGRYSVLYLRCSHFPPRFPPELTNEIRGERLRFVEAMKEATAINVQGKLNSRTKGSRR